jgi:hypothetical protein
MQSDPPRPALQRCLKALKIKHLLANFNFVITHIFMFVKKPKSHRKATEKDTEKHQNIENQGVDENFFSFSVH